MIKIVFPREAGTTGMSLRVNGDMLEVLSPCCEFPVKLVVRSSGESDAFCSACDTLVLTDSQFIASFRMFEYSTLNGSIWSDWGKSWFGITDFEMEIKV